MRTGACVAGRNSLEQLFRLQSIRKTNAADSTQPDGELHLEIADDVLCDIHVGGKYRDVILPMVVTDAPPR